MSRGFRRPLAAAAAIAVAVGVGGCGVPERVIGLRDAPAELTAGAAFSEAAAQQIAARVLGDAAAAEGAGDKAAAQRKAVLTGPALRVAEVRDRFTGGEEPAAPVKPPTPTVLAVSKGKGWPRSILATTLADGVQSLHVLTSESATTPFKLFVTTRMDPGAGVPALPPVADGTTRVTDGTGLVGSPVQILTSYSDQLDIPANTADSALVATTDPFAEGITVSSKAQIKALGKLGTLRRSNSVVDDEIIAFRLADGSALVFGQLIRKDVVRPTGKARRLDLPANLAKLSGKKSVTKTLELEWLETLAAVVPTRTEATVIGVTEQMRHITAR